MKRFLIGLALCFMPVFSFALPICEPSKTSFSCSVDTDTGDRKACSFYQYNKGGQTTFDCELPDNYKDEKGRACFKNDELSPCEKVQEENQNSDEKKPKNKKPPEEGKIPKGHSTGGKCYSNDWYSVEGGVCASGGWRYTIIAPNLPAGYTCSNTFYPRKEVPCKEDKDPKQPAPNDGKQPKHEDGKQPKGEGQGDSSEDGDGKGNKGEGNGKGEGSGDAEGKGMFKGGAGSGHISEVRVPRSRDGLGWRGDFFLRNTNQCPQDKTMSILGRQVVFSYAKICQYLDMLAPVVKAVFMFVAGLMVVKSIRAK